MNERIKELMKQSMVEYQFDLRFSPEKFAELIVQECAEQVKNMRVNDYGISGAEIIREHFGVQE